MRDYYDETALGRCRAVGRGPGHAGLAARLALVGHFKDSSSGYLRAFGWTRSRMERQGTIDATAIRDALPGASASTPEAALAPWAPHIPAATRAWLE